MYSKIRKDNINERILENLRISPIGDKLVQEKIAD